MSLPKIERNAAIVSAVGAGEPLKSVASRFGLSVARVSKITQDVTPPTPITISDAKPTLLAMQTLLNALLNQV